MWGVREVMLGPPGQPVACQLQEGWMGRWGAGAQCATWGGGTLDVADPSCPSAWILRMGHGESSGRGGMAGAGGGQLRLGGGGGLGREWERTLLRAAQQALPSPRGAGGAAGARCRPAELRGGRDPSCAEGPWADCWGRC